MDDIKDVVHSIVRGCEQTGVEVPEVLAAFVARTVSLLICIRMLNKPSRVLYTLILFAP